MKRFDLGVRAFAAALLVWGAAGCATHDVSKRNDACNPDLVHPRKNNPLFWYRCRDPDAVLVFVHGGASDSLEAWQNTEALGFWGGRLLQKAFFVRSPLTGRTLYWPWIAAHDARLESASIVIVGYFTGLFTGPYGVDAAAEEWFTYLRTPNPATGRAVMDHRNILIIAHSAGASSRATCSRSTGPLSPAGGSGCCSWLQVAAGRSWSTTMQPSSRFFFTDSAGSCKPARSS